MSSAGRGLFRGLVRGAAAEAAGTTGLNAATYLDMAVRGRGSSSAPQDIIEKTAGKVGVDIPGEGEARDNRLAGLGPLSGITVGVVVGAIAGATKSMLNRRNGPTQLIATALATGAAAMMLADAPMKALGVSDPADWRAQDWAADAIPHLLYGIVTAATLAATEGGAGDQ